jgi:2-isopropylmalate synthase
MPYLPLDPKDLGRSYEAVIRVNSQSGKGGIAYLLESEYGLELPRRLQIEFSQVVQHVMDGTGKEQSARDIHGLFEREYRLDDHLLLSHAVQPAADKQVRLQAQVRWAGRTVDIDGQGNGPIDAFVNGLQSGLAKTVRVLGYHEHSVSCGANAQALAYIELRIGERTLFGVGRDADIVAASLKAILSGLNRTGMEVNTQEAIWQTN